MKVKFPGVLGVLGVLGHVPYYLYAQNSTEQALRKFREINIDAFGNSVILNEDPSKKQCNATLETIQGKPFYLDHQAHGVCGSGFNIICVESKVPDGLSLFEEQEGVRYALLYHGNLIYLDSNPEIQLTIDEEVEVAAQKYKDSLEAFLKTIIEVDPNVNDIDSFYDRIGRLEYAKQLWGDNRRNPEAYSYGFQQYIDMYVTGNQSEDGITDEEYNTLKIAYTQLYIAKKENEEVFMRRNKQAIESITPNNLGGLDVSTVAVLATDGRHLESCKSAGKNIGANSLVLTR